MTCFPFSNCQTIDEENEIKSLEEFNSLKENTKVIYLLVHSCTKACLKMIAEFNKLSDKYTKNNTQFRLVNEKYDLFEVNHVPAILYCTNNNVIEIKLEGLKCYLEENEEQLSKTQVNNEISKLRHEFELEQQQTKNKIASYPYSNYGEFSKKITPIYCPDTPDIMHRLKQLENSSNENMINEMTKSRKEDLATAFPFLKTREKLNS